MLPFSSFPLTLFPFPLLSLSHLSQLQSLRKRSASQGVRADRQKRFDAVNFYTVAFDEALASNDAE